MSAKFATASPNAADGVDNSDHHSEPSGADGRDRRPTMSWAPPATPPQTPCAERWHGGFIHASVEQLLAAASLFWALSANRLFFIGALDKLVFADWHTWGFALALLLILAALHYLLLWPFATRHTVKPLLAVLLVTTVVATHFMQTLGVYLDPSMMRNVLRSDVAEARELLTWQLLPHLLVGAGLPLVVLFNVRIVPRRSWPRAVLARAVSVLLALVLLIAPLLLVFQPFASLMRNHKELRYRATPVNYLWSTGAVAASLAKGAAKPRQPIGLDARPGPLLAARQQGHARPLVVVLVVGETARAANWGLNAGANADTSAGTPGHARQTTPELARLPVINFKQVTSCGTNTETSLPCMFAPVGRRDYDEARIRGSESLLHVLARAGVAVQWRDNQSGCKGVCDGLPTDEVRSLELGGICDAGQCHDEGLLSGLSERLANVAKADKVDKARGTQLLVMHQLGNHGPAYFKRYPPAFARFQPACQQDDLQLCTQQEIVNAYDNALLYTDHVLASIIAKLQAAAPQVDTALVYVSDHGESLGENNLWLHGLPYAIAPDVQKRVPMVMWLSPGFMASRQLDGACLQRRAAQPAAHDHLFHTLLGLLDVQTALHDAAFDLARGCSTVGSAGAGALATMAAGAR